MIPNHDLFLNPRKIYKKIIEILKEDGEMIKCKGCDTTAWCANITERMKELNFWNLYCTSDRICMHIYRNGKRAGQICGNKVFITTDNKLQKFLCSRHCRDYIPKGRTYSGGYKRCSYIRTNGEQCKHKCSLRASYCYMHATNEAIDNSDRLIYNEAINRLKRKRNLYYKLKKSRNRKQKLYTQNFKEEKLKMYEDICRSNKNLYSVDPCLGHEVDYRLIGIT